MPISRRGCLTGAGVPLGASALIGLGVNELSREMLPQATATDPATPAYEYGKGKSGTKQVLVGYATGTGSTVGYPVPAKVRVTGNHFRIEARWGGVTLATRPVDGPTATGPRAEQGE